MQSLLLRVRSIALAHLVGILVFCLAPLSRAQNANTGEIKGTVIDPSGAVVPGVEIAMKNTQTGVITRATTNGAGLYDVPFLVPGEYSITFSKQGFNNFVRQGIGLQIQTLQINATLQVGAAAQEVVVTSAPPLLETESSAQHVDLGSQQIAAAPIVGTNWESEMTQLIPGVNNGGGAGEAVGQAIGVNGTAGYNVNFLIDGSSATEPRDFNSSNNYMPIDAIQEISIDASATLLLSMAMALLPLTSSPKAERTSFTEAHMSSFKTPSLMPEVSIIRPGQNQSSTGITTAEA